MSEGSGSHALSRASAWMLCEPGRWTGMSLMSYRLQNSRRRIVRQVSLNDLVLPSLMMYDTTMALSYIRHSTRDLSWGKNPATPGSTASISNILMCWFACCLDNVHCSLWEPSYAPICGWRHLWSLPLRHSVRPPAALQGRTTKPPHGEWSGSLKSCLTRTLSPDTRPLMPITGLGVEAELISWH